MRSKQQARDVEQGGAVERAAAAARAGGAGRGNSAQLGMMGMGMRAAGGGGFGWGRAAAADEEEGAAQAPGPARGAGRAARGGPSSAGPRAASAHGGGAGAHAGACGCAQCLGGGMSERHPDFREIGADGVERRPGAAPAAPAAGAPALGTGPAAPSLDGVGEAASAGAYTSGRHPDFPGVLGQTWFSVPDLPAAPRVSFTVEENYLPWKEDYTVRVKPVAEPAAASWPVLCTPENNDGYKISTPQPEYPDLDHYVIVSSDAAAHIVQAEEQHVQDLDQGWLIAAIHLADGINRVAGGEGLSGADPSALQSALAADIVAELGGYGQTIKGAVASGGSMESPVTTAMGKAFAASKTARDKSGSHTLPLQLYTAHVDQGKVASKVTEDKVPGGPSAGAVVTTETLA